MDFIIRIQFRDNNIIFKFFMLQSGNIGSFKLNPSNGNTNSPNTGNFLLNYDTSNKDEINLPYSDEEIDKLVYTLLANALDSFKSVEGKRTSFRECPFCKNSIGTNGGNFKKHCMTCCDLIAEKLNLIQNGAYFGSKKMIEDAKLVELGMQKRSLYSKEERDKMINEINQILKKKLIKKRKRDDGEDNPISLDKKKIDRKEDNEENIEIMNKQTKFESLLNGSFVSSLSTQALKLKSSEEIQKDSEILQSTFQEVRKYCYSNIIPKYIILEHKTRFKENE